MTPTDWSYVEEDGLDITEGATLYTGAWIAAAVAVAVALVLVLLARKVTRG